MFFINSERLLQGILPQVSETSIFVRLLSLIISGSQSMKISV